MAGGKLAALIERRNTRDNVTDRMPPPRGD
jgi:hypothetical protein